MKIIINADDFGKNSTVNEAIVEAFKRGFITNTTIMANMDSYDEAVELSKKNGFFDKVGLHLNLTEGIPLSHEMINNSFFIQNQYFNKNSLRKNLKNQFILNKKNNNAIVFEAKQQILKYLNSGFTEMHIDSHHHIHTVYSVYKQVHKIIKNKFKTVRLSLNLTKLKKNLFIKIYKKFFNLLIKKDFNTTTYFTSASDFIELAKQYYDENQKKFFWPKKFKNCILEIMVHPSYDENGKLVNLYDKSQFDELLKYVHQLELISYKDIH